MVLNLLAVAAVVAVLVLMLLSVTMRYLIGNPFRFTEELTGLLMTAIIFFTLPLTIIQGSNIRSTFIVDVLRPRQRAYARVLGEFVMIAFAGIFAWESWKSTAFTIRLGLRTEAAGLALAPWMIGMTAALVFCVLLAVVAIFRSGRSS